MRRWLVPSLVILALLASLYLGAKAYRIKGHLTALRHDLATLEARVDPSALSALDADALVPLEGAFAALEADLEGLKAEAGPFLALAPYLGWVPGVGGDLKAAPSLLEAASLMTEAGKEAIGLARALLSSLSDPSSAAGVGERFLLALEANEAQVASVQDKLARALKEYRQVDKDALSPRLARQVKRLDRYIPLLELALEGSSLVPELLGASEARSYLLLAQNNHELRATGGFISGVGLVEVERGRITHLEFKDSYAVDDLSKPHPAPPAPLTRYMSAGLLVLRDANWSPDFPTSAQVIESLYQLDQGIEVDGVIAADLTALELLVGAIGPIRVKEYDEWVDGKDVLEKIKTYWAPPPGQRPTRKWWYHRKDFIGALLKAIMAKVEGDIKGPQLIKLMQAAKKALDEKHLLIYLNDQRAAEALNRLGWDGSLSPTEGDYLLVVDTNMGFNKVNPKIQVSIDYTVTLREDGRAQARLEVLYRHTAQIRLEECVHEARYGRTYDDLMQRCYWNYVRVYMPAGSELQEAVGSFEPDTPESYQGEGDREVWAAFFILAPGEEKGFTLTYELPFNVREAGRYSLVVQKQPGTLAVPLRVCLRLPPGWEPLSVQPLPTSSKDGELLFKTTLRTDREFTVVFR